MPKEDKGTVDKLLDTVQSFKKKENESKGGMIAGIIAAILALITIAGFAFKAWRSGKKLAKLLHEKAVSEETVRQEEANARIAQYQEDKVSALIAVEAEKRNLRELEAEAVRLEEERDEAKEVIRRINSWDDVDRIVR